MITTTTTAATTFTTTSSSVTPKLLGSRDSNVLLPEELGRVLHGATVDGVGQLKVKLR